MLGRGTSKIYLRPGLLALSPSVQGKKEEEDFLSLPKVDGEKVL